MTEDSLSKVVSQIEIYRENIRENWGRLDRQEVTGILIFLEKMSDRLKDLDLTLAKNPKIDFNSPSGGHARLPLTASRQAGAPRPQSPSCWPE